MATTDPTYPSRPLNPARREIRILTLLPGSFDDSTECILQIHEQVNHQAGTDELIYEALSYTWGETKRHETIKLNENEHFPVTDNLAAALRRLRDRRHPRKLWVDALCIDQCNLAERSAQVAQMVSIFQLSQRTVIWLGETKESNVEGRSSAESHRRLIPRVDEILHSDARPFWWTRAWVAQEFTLSPNEPTVHAGPFHFSSAELFDLFEGSRPRVDECDRSDFVRAQISLTGLRKLRAGGLGSKLPGLIFQTRLANATLPKDRVYALLGMTTSKEAGLIDPDYTKSDRQVFGDAVKAAILAKGDFDALKLVAVREQSQLPSWMIDFSVPGEIVPGLASFENYLKPAQGRRARSRKAFSIGKRVQFSADMKYMFCHGSTIDIVAAVSELDHVREAGVQLKDRASALLAGLIGQPPPQSPYCVLFERQIIANSAPLGNVYNAPANVDTYDVEERRYLSARESTFYAVAVVEKLFQLWSDRVCPDDGRKIRVDRLDIFPPLPLFGQYTTYRSTRGGNMHLLQTECGFLGCAAIGVQRGDQIVLLAGSQQPVVLRACADGMFTFEGMAYVHGMMHGELDVREESARDFVIK